MSDVDELWTRIDDARTRLGQVDQAQVRQAEDLSKRLKEIRTGLARRHEEVEVRHAESDRLRHENEQLRRMLHRLLLSIEERYSGRLKTALQEIAEQVGGLMKMADTVDKAATDAVGDGEAPSGEAELPSGEAESPLEADVDSTAGAAPLSGQLSALPDEDDSVWLKQIMERARELTAEAERGHDAPASAPSGTASTALSRSAVA